MTKIIAAPSTRNCASARAPNPVKASLPAMMLLAQQTVTSSISKCMRPWPARVAGLAAGIGAALLKRLLPHRQLFDPLPIGVYPNPAAWGT